MAESEDVKDVEEDVRQLLNIFDLWCPVNKEEKVGPDLTRSGLPLVHASVRPAPAARCPEAFEGHVGGAVARGHHGRQLLGQALVPQGRSRAALLAALPFSLCWLVSRTGP